MSYCSYDSDDDYKSIKLFEPTRVTVGDWHSLVEPNAKVETGVGSGQLHRKGRNYIPVDEKLIVDRRMGRALPKGGLSGTKKRKGKYIPRYMTCPRLSSRPPVRPGSNAWSTSTLCETPFWETPSGPLVERSRAQAFDRPGYDQHFDSQPLAISAPRYTTRQYDRIPLLVFRIQLTVGVSVVLSVYADDNPVHVVNEFVSRHQLVMTDKAKFIFAENVKFYLIQFH